MLQSGIFCLSVKFLPSHRYLFWTFWIDVVLYFPFWINCVTLRFIYCLSSPHSPCFIYFFGETIESPNFPNVMTLKELNISSVSIFRPLNLQWNRWACIYSFYPRKFFYEVNRKSYYDCHLQNTNKKQIKTKQKKTLFKGARIYRRKKIV